MYIPVVRSACDHVCCGLVWFYEKWLYSNFPPLSSFSFSRSSPSFCILRSHSKSVEASGSKWIFQSGPVPLADFRSPLVFSDGTSCCVSSSFCCVLVGWLGMSCRQSADSAPRPSLPLLSPAPLRARGEFWYRYMDTDCWGWISVLRLKHLLSVALGMAVLLRSSLSHKWCHGGTQ